MSKIVIIIVVGWVIRSVVQAFKKALAEAKQELAEKLRQAQAAHDSERVASKVVESTIDYDDEATESDTDYDDEADEDAVDYDDAPPPAPVVYAIADDTTSGTVNQAVKVEIARHVTPRAAPRAPVHGLGQESLKSRALVRDSVIMETLLRRYPRNPLFHTRSRGS